MHYRCAYWLAIIAMALAATVRAQSTRPGRELPELEYPEYFTGLQKAQLQQFRGRYELALDTLAEVKEGEPEQIALVRARALAATGRRQEALQTLAAPHIKDQAAVQIQRARILAEMGRLDEALAVLGEHLGKYRRSIAGHYWLGFISELKGDTYGAAGAYAWFVAPEQNFLVRWEGMGEKAFADAAGGMNPQDLVLTGLALDRNALLTSSYGTNRRLHDTILSIFVKTYDAIDRGYWPAHVAAAKYFLWHDMAREASEELAAALESNPRDVQTLELQAKIAMRDFNFDAVDGRIQLIREVDRNSAVADILEARNLLLARRPRDAQTPLRRVLASQPHNLEALGLLAGSEALQLHQQEAARIIKTVEEIDPDNASAHMEVAEQLAAVRQYRGAIQHYKIAIERAPWWTEARNSLGLLYTQSGDEELARVTLEAAHAMDQFNLRTTNYLRLLDQMDGMARKESSHFVVSYDAKLDAVIAEYFPLYLESIYPQVCAAYGQELADKTLVEVFATHDAFAVRTTGAPWIPTVGASTGRVIALVAPRGGQGAMGPFNWAQVLRHEFTHTVTLAASDNRIPHWMTEGLAVSEEKVPLRWEWIPLLYQAATDNELFSLQDLTWAFVRPKKATDRTMAYAQSFWVCQYIQERYGHDAVLKMLAAFARGAAEEDVFPDVLGCNIGQFDKDFAAWARVQVGSWGYDPATTAKYEELRSRGEELIKGRDYAAALPVWLEAAKLRPMDALPHQRLAGLYLTSAINQPGEAIPHLTALHELELKDSAYAKRIARLYRDSGDTNNAIHWAIEAVYVQPYDIAAHQLLAELYGKGGHDQELAREQRVISMLEPAGGSQ